MIRAGLSSADGVAPQNMASQAIQADGEQVVIFKCRYQNPIPDNDR
jgi:hypothetical protein